jgi:hypothetical protein
MPMPATRASFDPATDYYGLLDVHPTAPPWEIQAAYRRLAKTYHPDLNAGSSVAAARMARLNRAKEVLLDRATREAYDTARRLRYSPAARLAAASYPSQPGWAGPTATTAAYAAARARQYAAPAQTSWMDRQTAVMLAIALPLVLGLALYLFEAVQMAGRPAHYASDLALAPVSSANVAGTARNAFALVAGQPPSARTGAAANRVIQRLVDSSPEAELLRYEGRVLMQAGESGDRQAWDRAVLELCRVAEHC